jgi:hypothetical protein
MNARLRNFSGPRFPWGPRGKIPPTYMGNPFLRVFTETLSLPQTRYLHNFTADSFLFVKVDLQVIATTNENILLSTN